MTSDSLPDAPVPALSSSALSDALDAASLAVLLAESGDAAGMRSVLASAFDSADGAFPAGSPRAEALVTVLSAVWLVPEVTA